MRLLRENLPTPDARAAGQDVGRMRAMHRDLRRNDFRVMPEDDTRQFRARFRDFKDW